MDIVLLSIIALSEVLRLILTHRPISKKRHFKQRRDGTERMIWDLEFKRFKGREIREEVRREYDNKLAKLAALTEKIKQLETIKDKNIGEFNRLGDDKILLERDINRHKDQMKSLDLEIAGSRPTNEYPEGVQGIEQQIDSLRQLQGMVDDWIKTL